ncbi:RNA polymerase sigma factor [Negadavirga shengliensis]|uniref:RNA polymerase sigma factor n=1 Tax=Negadavirga shengliensis TaxID=1389218 RepID=A0ABV9SWH9_9BACT
MGCWRLLKEGNKEGLEKLYSLYVDDLFNYGMSIISNSDLIQDYIHEVFLDLWKYRNNLKDTGNVKFYLYKCLKNKIYAAEKLHQKQRNMIYPQGLMEDFSMGFEWEENEDGLQKRLLEALDSLPVRQKEVLHFLFYENKDYKEVSKVMGINLRSVYTLSWKAISKLKNMMTHAMMLWLASSLQ